MFLDGDAFPIADVVPFLSEKLRHYPLVAVQRRENLGDPPPHPCFCVTTVRFWKDIHGDWKEGYRWRNQQGWPVTDVGGNLLGLLEAAQLPWFPMRRSNKRELHPLWFGIYEDLVYHHGAGFRNPLSRFDMQHLAARPPARQVAGWLLGRLNAKWDPVHRLVAANSVLSDQVYQSILADLAFERWFQGAGDAAAERPESDPKLDE